MRKKTESYLDAEAMRFGYQVMLADVKDQLEAGMHSASIRSLMKDRLTFIEKRLKELSEDTIE